MYIMGDYDDALASILERGIRKSNRTGVDTLSLFGLNCRYPIDTYFPLLTKRRVWPKSIFAELLWILSGSTNVNDLEGMGSKIWTPWRSQAFEQEKGYPDGDMGPIYGFQLRNFGGNYRRTYSMATTGFDQLQYLLDELKQNPNSRRLLWSLWNPAQLDDMRLPPCHVMFQLYVYDGKLSGMLTQRSADMMPGACANIQFYSALIYMFAQQAGYTPGEFVHSIGDAHIYINQIEATEKYLERESPDSPKLVLKKAESIFDYNLDSFEILDYNPLSAIKVPVAV